VGTIYAGTSLIKHKGSMPPPPDLESAIDQYYASLYQFAFSLVRNEDEACDLTQHTFFICASKGHQLRELGKIKTWLFTTLYREFLGRKRKQLRFPHVELESVKEQYAEPSASAPDRLDAAQALRALARLDQPFQAPIALFYLQDCSYQEIAEILQIPLGTVKSRLARGIAQLQKKMNVSLPPHSPCGSQKEPHG
jgi:RNA polymerase sigma-70 factor (ECF subfamily)